MESDWKEFVERGNRLFNYMAIHVEDMLDGMNVKHFDTCYATHSMYYYHDYLIDKTYKQTVQPSLAQWIREEHRSGRLTESSNWKPFRDQYVLSTMYLGYNKLFLHESQKGFFTCSKPQEDGAFKDSFSDSCTAHYFQLAVDEGCIGCVYCDNNEIVHQTATPHTSKIHFELALYGWLEDGKNMVQPDNDMVLSDHMMPEIEWNINNCMNLNLNLNLNT